jgi:hypothetical protein
VIVAVLVALAVIVAVAAFFIVRGNRSTTTVQRPVATFADTPAGTLTVALGNDAVAQVLKTPDEHGMIADRRVARPDLGRRVTTFGPFPADWPASESLLAISRAWGHHSDLPPAWLESNDPDFGRLVAAELKCPVGRPANWQEDEDA